MSLSRSPIHGNSLIYYMKLLIHFLMNLFKFGIKKEKVHDSIIMFPVKRLNVIVRVNLMVLLYPSILGNIDPDINYLNSNNKVKDTPYYNDQSFTKKFNRDNDSLSMLHLNIRSIPDRFLQLTSLLSNLNIELKIIAISET